jgi:predicted nuclease of restriction endonuclease-like (RecB) superfamily
VLEIEIIKSNEYAKFLSDLREKVRRSQQKAVLQVNQQLILLYHHIGSEIIRLQKEKGWGGKVIDQLSLDLKSSFPYMKGFGITNLKYMRLLAESFSSDEISQQAVDQLPWSHLIRILTAVDDSKIRLFYIAKSKENNWSRETLKIQIENRLHERVGKAVTNFKSKLPVSISDMAVQSLHDPYCFDFLGIHDEAHEREIEKSLIIHVEKFLVELGVGFAFLGRQYKLVVSETAYYLDLLFYHTKLHCYVVIELKATDFKPEYVGKLNFYLSAVDDLIKDRSDNPTIGLILCKGKDNIKAEYALKDINKPIGVSEYKLSKAIPENLKTALPSVEEIEAQLNREQIDRG